MQNLQSIFDSFRTGNLKPFYRHAYPGLLLYAGKILAPEVAFMAEDCVQDSVIQAYSRRDVFESAEQWYTFILTCIRNKAVSMMRKSRSGRLYIEENNPDDTPEPDMSLTMIENETLELLYQAIQNLPDNLRQLLDLSFEQGLKNAEVAQRLGVAEITVKKQKAKLITMLRTRLGGILDDKSIILLLSSGAANHLCQ